MSLAAGTAVSCQLSDLPMAQNVDASDLSGTWYAVARLRGSNVLDAATIRIGIQDDRTYSLLYTGAKYEILI